MCREHAGPTAATAAPLTSHLLTTLEEAVGRRSREDSAMRLSNVDRLSRISAVHSEAPTFPHGMVTRVSSSSAKASVWRSA